LTKEDKTKLSLGDFVSDIDEALLARTHLMREWALKWILSPILIAPVFACLILLILDAVGCIRPMREGLLSIIRWVLTSGVVSSALGAGFGWLFDRGKD
jgi:hypothetical protein